MKMILLDRNEDYIGNVQGAIIAERHAEINGHDLLLLETLSELEKGQRIVYQDELNYWHEYIVREVKKRHDSGLQYSIYCESSFYELLGDYIEDKRPTNTTATAALSTALEPTRWQVGQVDNLGLGSTNFYQISAKEAIAKIAEVWKGEIRTRITVVGNQITGRFVDLKSLIGNDLGKRFSYDKDMPAITKTVARADVITALYGYGRGEEVGDGFGRRLRFGEINDGVDYVENLDAKAIWGRLNPDGSRSHVFGKEIFDEVEDMVELKAKTEDKLVELSQPMISYTADVLDLKAAGFDHEGVGLGDTCIIIDKEFEPELRISGRVIAVIEDLIGKRKTITLGNYLPIITDSISKQEAFINSFRARSSVWDRSGSFGEDGKLSSSFIDGAIDVLKNQLLSAQSGWYTDTNGNLVLDAVNGESSMMLSGAGFMIANTKLPNGEWDYRTFGTGNGFTADMIVLGALVGGNVAWNLEDGTLLIGESTENYQLYFDGTTLKFGDNVTLTWSNITNTPTILDSTDVTTITNNTIQTTNVVASNLNVNAANIMGTLVASQINTQGLVTQYISDTDNLSTGYATIGKIIGQAEGIEFIGSDNKKFHLINRVNGGFGLNTTNESGNYVMRLNMSQNGDTRFYPGGGSILLLSTDYQIFHPLGGSLILGANFYANADRVEIRVNGDYVLVSSGQTTRIEQTGTSSNNQLGVDNGGAFKVVGGVKTYL